MPHGCVRPSVRNRRVGRPVLERGEDGCRRPARCTGRRVAGRRRSRGGERPQARPRSRVASSTPQAVMEQRAFDAQVRLGLEVADAPAIAEAVYDGRLIAPEGLVRLLSGTAPLVPLAAVRALRRSYLAGGVGRAGRAGRSGRRLELRCSRRAPSAPTCARCRRCCSHRPCDPAERRRAQATAAAAPCAAAASGGSALPARRRVLLRPTASGSRANAIARCRVRVG
jgi:hypothetical protein